MKKKFTALILALVLLLSQSLVFAVGLDVTEDTVSDASEPEILAEDVSKRDEFEKHYKPKNCSSANRQQQVFYVLRILCNKGELE